MKHAVLALLALATAGPALAQEPQLDWSSIPTQSGLTAAWAVKPATAADKPRIFIVMRTSREAEPRTEIRESKVVAMDVDCAAGKVRPVYEKTYNAAYAETASEAVATDWVYLYAVGELGNIVSYHCRTPNPPLLWKADVMGAQQKLDAALPKLSFPPMPPQSGTFELVGDSGVAYQPYDIWLETTSITREGNLAKAWAADVWVNSWDALRSGNGSAVTWRLYEIECVERPRTRNIFFEQYGQDLKDGSGYPTTVADAKFSVAGDVNLKALALRVCNGRPLHFSETVKGDLKTLISTHYVGAAQKLGGPPLAKKPPAQPVDLGPTIRLVDQNPYWTYKGTFTRSGDSNSYTGKFEAEGINPLPATLSVVGIRDGRLLIERSGTPGGLMAFPVANGKVSGKGVAYWERQNDEHSVTLVEPATITLK